MIDVVKCFNIFYVVEIFSELFKFVDVVVICIFNKFYVDLFIEVLNYGVYVLCEKLMVMMMEECDRMIEVVNKNYKLLIVVYYYCYIDVVIIVKKVIEVGVVGKLLVVCV